MAVSIFKQTLIEGGFNCESWLVELYSSQGGETGEFFLPSNLNMPLNWVEVIPLNNHSSILPEAFPNMMAYAEVSTIPAAPLHYDTLVSQNDPYIYVRNNGQAAAYLYVKVHLGRTHSMSR